MDFYKSFGYYCARIFIWLTVKQKFVPGYMYVNGCWVGVDRWMGAFVEIPGNGNIFYCFYNFFCIMPSIL